MSKRTPATQAMEKAGRPFELLEYPFDPHVDSKGLAAAEALGLPPRQVFKTLMAEAGREVLVAVVPSDCELNLKALAQLAGQKAAAMLKPADAERISGYKVGGISPLGQKKRLRTFLDESALGLPFIVVNGGQRGLQIRAAPADLLAACDGVAAPIAVQRR
ncbi:Cys-tRNA(Pro) deacylase [Pseudoxanthobacter sp.]|uniref:Cys-tRNA(Pro) deacylase n=1 Tax=Pseudoxanthobacter sp. TaxID=1925742 RepID=UPI002FE2ED34